ncbi:MFS transporter [Methanocella sp. CWC-04]|uniref:MFS transporter n=2 Tax=Methanooceanicella nereidis TaxID=2052831 RepID=A0AAP2W7C6_9EURY|nr:MFS transporter [Methanocella sp. CWC-04]MCD1294941.1 MFS transporter [Methanocella sp. CWC-04]
MSEGSSKVAASREVHEDRYIILVIVLIGIFMAVLDGSIVTISLPTITGYFDVNVSQSQWVVTAYLIAMTSLLLIFGRISEYTGKTKLFFIGFAIFSLSSLACGISDELYKLIIFRIAQAIGASMVFSISTAIIVQAFPDNERGRALGFVGTTVALGGIMGPILGGYIVDTLGWQYIFLVNVPIGIILLTVAFKFLKLKEMKAKNFNMDVTGALLLILTVVSLMMFLGDLAGNYNVNGVMIAYVLVFILSAAALVISETKHSYPIVDFSVFKVRKFAFSNLSLLINFVIVFMFNFLMPFYFEGVKDFRPSQVGQVLIIIPMIMSIASPISGWIYDRYQSIYHSSLGMLMMAVSLLMIGYFASRMDVTMILASFVLFGIGNGLFQSPNNSEVMGSLPMSKSGTASSMIATVRNMGMTLGVSFGSILLSVFLINSGFTGPALYAGKDILSAAISNVLYAGGILGIIGVITSMMRRR